jgi:ABC-type nitrate/sulfonate/bicarbonate transport system permease component
MQSGWEWGLILRGIAARLLNLALGISIFLLCWIALAAYLHRDIMPYPWDVIPVFVEEIQGDLWHHTVVSAGRVLKAIFFAVIIATPVGMGLGQIRVLNRIFSPLIALVHPIPKIVFLPVILVVLGIDETSKVFLITLILFFQILVVVRDEAASLRPELIQSVRSLGAGRRALFRYVYLPASLPAVLTALRVSVGTAIAVLFIAQRPGLLHRHADVAAPPLRQNVRGHHGDESARPYAIHGDRRAGADRRALALRGRVVRRHHSNADAELLDVYRRGVLQYAPAR